MKNSINSTNKQLKRSSWKPLLYMKPSHNPEKSTNYPNPSSLCQYIFSLSEHHWVDNLQHIQFVGTSLELYLELIVLEVPSVRWNITTSSLVGYLLKSLPRNQKMPLRYLPSEVNFVLWLVTLKYILQSIIQTAQPCSP